MCLRFIIHHFHLRGWYGNKLFRIRLSCPCHLSNLVHRVQNTSFYQLICMLANTVSGPGFLPHWLVNSSWRTTQAPLVRNALPQKLYSSVKSKHFKQVYLHSGKPSEWQGACPTSLSSSRKGNYVIFSTVFGIVGSSNPGKLPLVIHVPKVQDNLKIFQCQSCLGANRHSVRPRVSGSTVVITIESYTCPLQYYLETGY